ncbi:MAG: Tripartite-type tricarboxylate transporter, receptor component TctC [Noviherbaspirillum sp.]|nr:Tripartite-type tricarboxylate transporter, receptor component TctC [Noviherbaspirillum sp.]
MNHDDIINIKRRHLMLAAAGGALLGASHASFAQSKGIGPGPVKIIVPFSPGTTPDLCARLLDQKLAQRLGQPVIVDNRPGASGILGMDMVAKAPPDGHTIMVGTSTALTMPYFYSKVPFDVIQSFQPLCMIGHTNFALVAHPSVPASNPKELIAHLKKNPGRVTYASPGRGTFHHLAMEQIAGITGTEMQHVPYKGSAGAFTDLVGGHVNLMIMPLHVAVPLQTQGKLKVIGSTRSERDAAFPNIPTLQEGGIAPFNTDAWYAVWGPKGMSKDIVALYSSALREALASPDVKKTLDTQGVSLKPGTPEDLAKLSQAEFEHWGKVTRAAKIQPE